MNKDKKKYPILLSIAGSDPSGGAGIQADIKAGSACGCFVATAIVAVVDENTVGVTGVHPIPVEFVSGQIKSVLEDIGADAVKIGMLHSSELIEAVRDSLLKYNVKNTVIDPVMVATSGDPLLLSEAIDTLRNRLLPLAKVITPNLPEGSLLLGRDIKGDRESMTDGAAELGHILGTSVYLKAGHASGENIMTDVLFDCETGRFHYFSSSKVDTVNTHGTGCSLSSSIGAFLAQGFSLPEACRKAKEYITEAISAGAEYKIGNGHGPVNHFYKFWK